MSEPFLQSAVRKKQSKTHTFFTNVFWRAFGAMAERVWHLLRGCAFTCCAWANSTWEAARKSLQARPQKMTQNTRIRDSRFQKHLSNPAPWPGFKIYDFKDQDLGDIAWVQEVFFWDLASRTLLLWGVYLFTQALDQHMWSCESIYIVRNVVWN